MVRTGALSARSLPRPETPTDSKIAAERPGRAHCRTRAHGAATRPRLRARTGSGSRRYALLAFAAAAILSTSCPAAPNSESAARGEPRTLVGRVVGVSDGDSLTLLVERTPVRIRLAQIDAPEFGQPYGKRAKAALSALVFDRQARVEVFDTDIYGRTVGAVFVGQIDVNREMVRGGHAWAYTQYSHSTQIIELEQAARTAKLGLWALPEDQREAPWIWRHASRAAQPTTGPLACKSQTRCREMADCAQARDYFERCGAGSLDGDGDGFPCESLCASNR